MQKPLSNTTFLTGFSSGLHAFASPGHPMMNSPGGIIAIPCGQPAPIAAAGNIINMNKTARTGDAFLCRLIGFLDIVISTELIL